jgi:hypothetical protein
MRDIGVVKDDEAWPFTDSPETGVFVARALWAGNEPLLGVRHHDDGDWTFWGSTEPTDENALALLVLVHLEHVVDRFPEVLELAELPLDRSAVRTSATHPFVQSE